MSLSVRQLEAQCKHRLQAGQRINVVHSYLLGEGMNETDAQNLLAKTLNILRRKATTTLIVGVVIAFICAIISVLVTQASEGTVYFVWWGPVLIGVIMGLVGLAKLIRLKKT